MALLFFLLRLALTWSLGALRLWPRTRSADGPPLWLCGALAIGVASCVTWGFVGVTLDHAFTLLALCAASMHGYVFWAGVAERRR